MMVTFVTHLMNSEQSRVAENILFEAARRLKRTRDGTSANRSLPTGARDCAFADAKCVRFKVNETRQATFSPPCARSYKVETKYFMQEALRCMYTKHGVRNGTVTERDAWIKGRDMFETKRRSWYGLTSHSDFRSCQVVRAFAKRIPAAPGITGYAHTAAPG